MWLRRLGKYLQALLLKNAPILKTLRKEETHLKKHVSWSRKNRSLESDSSTFQNFASLFERNYLSKAETDKKLSYLNHLKKKKIDVAEKMSLLGTKTSNRPPVNLKKKANKCFTFARKIKKVTWGWETAGSCWRGSRRYIILKQRKKGQQCC